MGIREETRRMDINEVSDVSLGFPVNLELSSSLWPPIRFGATRVNKFEDKLETLEPVDLGEMHGKGIANVDDDVILLRSGSLGRSASNARFKRMIGFSVLHPMGWAACWLPSEQYAIESLNVIDVVQTDKLPRDRIGSQPTSAIEFTLVYVGSPAISSDGMGKYNGDTSPVSPYPYEFNGVVRGRKTSILLECISAYGDPQRLYSTGFLLTRR
ncbi:putative basic-leucine zipper domain-containing protein [Tanacetum coccineum]